MEEAEGERERVLGRQGRDACPWRCFGDLYVFGSRCSGWSQSKGVVRRPVYCEGGMLECGFVEE